MTLQPEYSSPPILLAQLGNGMINLSASNEELKIAQSQRRHARTALNSATANVLQCATHGIVIGCGGIGWYVGMALAMADICRHIVLYDADDIEEVNLNRLPVSMAAVGHNKATVLATEILRVRPGQVVSAVSTMFPDDAVWLYLESILRSTTPSVALRGGLGYTYTETIFHGGVLHNITPVGRTTRVPSIALIFDCTDNPGFQNTLAEALQNLPYPYSSSNIIHTRISYDGVSHITIKHATQARILNEQAGRYTITPSWSLPAQLAATLGVYAALQKMAILFPSVTTLLPVAAIGDEYGDVLRPSQQEVHDEQEEEE